MTKTFQDWWDSNGLIEEDMLIKVVAKHLWDDAQEIALEELAQLKQENQILIEELKNARAEHGRFGVGA